MISKFMATRVAGRLHTAEVAQSSIDMSDTEQRAKLEK